MDEKKFEHGALKAGFSAAIAIGWLVFVILFLAFPTLFSMEGFRINEKFAIIILSILIMAVLLGGLWLFWSVQMMSKKDWELFKIKGFKWRIIGTLVFLFALLIVLIYGFWYIWTDFSFWQYVAIFLVIILISGGLMGAVWAPWSAKYKDEMDKYGKDFGKKFEEGFKESFEKKDEKDD
jgi:magnesium-transporting ATPase (P-type)